MKRTGRKQEWSVTFFFIALLCLTPPLINIFNRPGFLDGIPTAYLLMFVLWGAMILVTALGARRRPIPPPSTAIQQPTPNLTTPEENA